MSTLARSVIEEELGSGDGVGSAEEVDFHTPILPSRRPACALGMRVAVPTWAFQTRLVYPSRSAALPLGWFPAQQRGHAATGLGTRRHRYDEDEW